MAIHIGNRIKERAKEIRMGATELAKMINTSKQNVYGIFKRQSLDTEQLLQLSCVLDYNFFSHYVGEYETKTGNSEKKNSLASELEKYQKELKTAKKEIEYIKEINKLLRKNSKN